MDIAVVAIAVPHSSSTICRAAGTGGVGKTWCIRNGGVKLYEFAQDLKKRIFILFAENLSLWVFGSQTSPLDL